MLQIPCWRVDVTVGTDLVKTLYETATTSKAAIGKAKHKMRGAVSNAGAFKFKATREDDAPARHHSTRSNHAEEDLKRALKTLHDIVDGKIDILAASQSDRATLREFGYVATGRNGNSYVTKAGKNAVKAIAASRGRS